MNEELPAGSVSLEEPQSPPPDPNVPPPDPQDGDPEGTVVNPGGEKLVPLSVVAALRGELKTVKGDNATLKGKADQLDKIAGEWQAAQPIIERAKQIASQPPPPQPPPPKPAGPLSDQEAIEYAKDLDLYRADGQPDVERAQRLATRQQAIAQTQAQQMVNPLLQHTAQGQSHANFESAANFTGQNGLKVDRGILQAVWSTVPPELSAQPNVAAVLYRQAVAEMVLQGKWKPGAEPPPPVVETSPLGGGGLPGAPTLTALDHAFRQAGDMTEKQFTQTRERYQPGRVNSLE